MNALVEINYRIVICGIIALTIIYLALIFTDNITDSVSMIIIGCIALAIGIVIPSPTVDNNKGVLKW